MLEKRLILQAGVIAPRPQAPDKDDDHLLTCPQALPGILWGMRKPARQPTSSRCLTCGEQPRFSQVEPRAEGEEMSERSLVDPTPELPDDTLIEDVRFATRIRNVLAAAGLKTVGEIRETAYETLLSFPDLGPGSIASLRKTLGLPSTDGVRPLGKKLA
jgi:hypothetical protein